MNKSKKVKFFYLMKFIVLKRPCFRKLFINSNVLPLKPALLIKLLNIFINPLTEYNFLFRHIL